MHVYVPPLAVGLKLTTKSIFIIKTSHLRRFKQNGQAFSRLHFSNIDVLLFHILNICVIMLVRKTQLLKDVNGHLLNCFN